MVRYDYVKMTQKTVLHCLPTLFYGRTSPPHIFMLKPLLPWTDGILLRIRLVIRRLNTFVLDENIFFLDFLGGQHRFTERNDTPCTFCTAEPCWTPKKCEKKIFFRELSELLISQYNLYFFFVEKTTERRSKMRTHKKMMYTYKKQIGKDFLFEYEIELEGDRTILLSLPPYL